MPEVISSPSVLQVRFTVSSSGSAVTGDSCTRGSEITSHPQAFNSRRVGERTCGNGS
jgi:hypothetical protein